jgi:DNA repair protein RecN (Recombination protein N)
MLRSLRISNLVLIRDAELELDAGLNAITGETGAGKTIFTNAIGLLLGSRGDAALIGAAGEEAYVEAEFDGVDDEALGALAELRPDEEDGVVLARRIFPDGRTRAYAWGRSAAREDVAAVAEALIAMSGQFEQRRLARPAYQRGVLDAFAGLDTRGAGRAWRELQAARRVHDELTRDAATAEARIEELRMLAADTDGLDLGREDELRAERERLRHVTELADGAAAAVAVLSPEDGAGASDLVAEAERSIAPLERLAPELRAAGDVLRQAELQLRESASDLRAFLDTLAAEPGRLEQVEAELESLSDLRRRYRAQTFAELLERGAEAGGGGGGGWGGGKKGR